MILSSLGSETAAQAKRIRMGKHFELKGRRVNSMHFTRVSLYVVHDNNEAYIKIN